MASRSPGLWHGLAVLIFVVIAMAQRDQDQKSQKNPNKVVKVRIGNFKIPMKDDRLADAIKNVSDVDDNLSDIYNDVFNIWSNVSFEDTPNITIANETLLDVVSKYWNEKDRAVYYPQVINPAKDVAIEYKKEDEEFYDVTLPNPDFYFWFTDAIFNMSLRNDWYSYGQYMGVGRSAKCAGDINDVIAGKDEWSKMGSAIATTMMALVPTLLALGTLYHPKNSEVYATSGLVGLSTALYTLGLPVKTISAVASSNQLSLAGLGTPALVLISRLGLVHKAHGRAKWYGPIGDLQAFTEDSESNDFAKARFSSIRDAVVRKWDERWHCWYLPNILVAAGQILMFYFAIFGLLTYLGVPRFIFSCGGSEKSLTAWYILGSALTNTVVRYILWEMSDHERAKAYALSDEARTRLERIVHRIDLDSDKTETTATDLPPLYPPFVRKAYDVGYKLKPYIPIIRKRIKYKGHTSSELEKRRKEWRKNQATEPPRSTTQTILDQARYAIKSIISWDTIKAGFLPSAKSARRHRPVYILLHLSPEGRSALRKLLTGTIEAALLLVLTLFFASQWAGNLFITAIAVSLLLLFITVGRAIGLIYVWISSRVWGLTVVACDTVDEVRGVLRILCSMHGCLVEVNGATYFEGYRMDVLGRDWVNFLEDYNTGKYDQDPPLPNDRNDIDEIDEDVSSMDIYGSQWKIKTRAFGPDPFLTTTNSHTSSTVSSKSGYDNAKQPATTARPISSSSSGPPPGPSYKQQDSSGFPSSSSRSAAQSSQKTQHAPRVRTGYTRVSSTNETNHIHMNTLQPGSNMHINTPSPGLEQAHDQQPLVSTATVIDDRM